MIGGIIWLGAKGYSQESFDQYNIPAEVKDLAFKIESKELNDTLKAKKVIAPDANVFARAYWYKGKSAVELEGAKGIRKEIRELIKASFDQKAALVWGDDFKKWISGYELERNSPLQKVYTDPSGVLEKSEITINRSKDKIIINEKKPIGTVRTTVSFIYPKWAKGKAVVSDTSQIAFEGSRVLRTKLKIKYAKVSNNVYLPSEVFGDSTQSVTFSSDQTVDRKVLERFKFSDFKINKDIADDKI